MSYPKKIKDKAISLRKKGKSLSEIANDIGISKGTASVWLKDVRLSENAIYNINKRRIIGQQNANIVKQNKAKKDLTVIEEKSNELLSNTNFTKDWQKIICSVLFWAEGSKSGSYVSFINSDPKMIKTFLTTMRKSFDLDENKFRGLVHIHDYHDDIKTKQYWSDISGIPLSQFTKSYNKPNTGKRKRAGYLGSFRVRYYDTKIAKELTAIFKILHNFV